MQAQPMVVDGNGQPQKNTAAKFYRVTRESTPDRDERVKALHERFVHRKLRRGAWDAQEARDLRAAESLRLWETCGCTSLMEYLVRNAGMDKRTAVERIRVGMALAELPRIEDALEAGHLSFSAVRELTRVVVGEKQDEWLEHVASMTSDEVARAVSGHKRGDSPDDYVDPNEHRHPLRFEVRDSTRARFKAAVRGVAKMRGHQFADDDELVQTIADVLEMYANGVLDSSPSPTTRGDAANDNAGPAQPLQGTNDDRTLRGTNDSRALPGPNDSRTTQGANDDRTLQGVRDRALRGANDDQPLQDVRDRTLRDANDDQTLQGVRDDQPLRGVSDDRTLQGVADDVRAEIARLSSRTWKAIRKALSRPPVHVWQFPDGTGAAHGVELPQAELDTMCCDSTNMGDILDPTVRVRKRDTGRERARILALFHNQCAVPGCNAEADDIHHIHHLEDGGTEDPKFKLPLCKGHHRMHHAMKLLITGEAPFKLTFELVTPVVDDDAEH